MQQAETTDSLAYTWSARNFCHCCQQGGTCDCTDLRPDLNPPGVPQLRLDITGCHTAAVNLVFQPGPNVFGGVDEWLGTHLCNRVWGWSQQGQQVITHVDLNLEHIFRFECAGGTPMLRIAIPERDGRYGFNGNGQGAATNVICSPGPPIEYQAMFANTSHGGVNSQVLSGPQFKPDDEQWPGWCEPCRGPEPGNAADEGDSFFFLVRTL